MIKRLSLNKGEGNQAMKNVLHWLKQVLVFELIERA